MLDEKVIGKMNKRELKQLVQELANDIDIIQKTSVRSKEFNFEDLEQKSKEISGAYTEIIKDEDGKVSIKNQLNALLDNLKKDEVEIDHAKVVLFGEEKITDSGESQKVKGLIDQVKDVHDRQQFKYETLYNKIEQDLKAGATSVKLSKSFADQVEKYKTAGRGWSTLMVLALTIAIYMSYKVILDYQLDTIDKVYVQFISRIPLIAFVVWLISFLGNRRAESKKLQESYTHKEVMASAFVGYKKTLEELGDQDKQLLTAHMNNLLGAIKEDSGAFLNAKGENHPLWDFLALWTLPQNKKQKVEEKSGSQSL